MKSKLPEGWREVKLGDIVELTMGQSPKSEFYNETGEGMPFMQGNTTFGEKYPTIERYTIKITRVAKKNDVLMSVRAPVGDLNICNIEQLCIGRGLCSIRMKNNMQEFLYFLMKYSMEKLKSRESGTVFASVNKSDIQNLPVKLPPIKEQKSIADTLSSLDNKIEINNKINENLEKQAQAIFKHWFIDFEFPDENGNPYKSSGGEMMESELGMIPKGWEVGEIDKYFEISIGRTPSRNKAFYFSHDDEDTPWVSIKDLGNSGIYISKTEEKLTKKSFEDLNIRIVPQNSVLMSFKLTIGRVAITDIDLTTNEAIAHFIDKSQSLIEYLYLYLKTFEFEKLGNTSSIGTAINSKIVRAMLFLNPHRDTINSFTKIISEIFKQIKTLEHQNQKLSQLRDTLLPKLMSGEIRIPLD